MRKRFTLLFSDDVAVAPYLSSTLTLIHPAQNVRGISILSCVLPYQSTAGADGIQGVQMTSSSHSLAKLNPHLIHKQDGTAIPVAASYSINLAFSTGVHTQLWSPVAEVWFDEPLSRLNDLTINLPYASLDNSGIAFVRLMGDHKAMVQIEMVADSF